MIRFSSSLLKNLAQRSVSLNQNNKSFFAKEPKGGKDDKKGGKQEKKQEAPVEQQPTQKLAPHQKIVHYFTPLQPALSPSETEALQRFTDLSETDKQILDQLAERIAELNTSMFYDLVFRREALGTTEAFVVGSGKWQDAEVNQAIKILRKDI